MRGIEAIGRCCDLTQQLHVAFSEARQRIALFNESSSPESELNALLRMLDEMADRSNPVLFTASKKPVLARMNNLTVNPDRRRDYRRADAHVLQDLVTTLATRPNRIPQRHNPNVKTGKLELFCIDLPQLILNLDPA